MFRHNRKHTRPNQRGQMKKPEITKGEWVAKGGAVYDTDKELSIVFWQTPERAKAISAVPEMIDALVETRSQLTIAMSNEEPIPTKVLVDWCTQVEQALKKAGYGE